MGNLLIALAKITWSIVDMVNRKELYPPCSENTWPMRKPDDSLGPTTVWFSQIGLYFVSSISHTLCSVFMKLWSNVYSSHQNHMQKLPLQGQDTMFHISCSLHICNSLKLNFEQMFLSSWPTFYVLSSIKNEHEN